ncbi:MAG: hypothetical protein VB095_10750 [Anaerovorax sp.]|nr:hypothetical protein [Anaerovorax sp.]
MEEKDYWAIVVPAAVTILGFIINYFVTKRNFKRELRKNKETKIYEIKLNAILDTMKFIDTYLSWHTINSGIVPVREPVTKKELTSQARNCYNLLCSTCESNGVIDCFIKIVFNDQSDNVFKLYNEFRRLARIELELKSNIEFDESNVFFSVVSTENLNSIEN